ncbi:MAG: choice-of-anchor tandem repeat GloVer-containing protein [Candidatus Sulfotelmatobacter sp.]
MSKAGAVVTLALFPALLLTVARPAHAQTEAVLYNFTGGSDGGSPQARLTPDVAGNFYGTTNAGGSSGSGTVFELSPNGSGGWNETVLYSFFGGSDGADPDYCYVIFDSAGNLYGTTLYGGANGDGVVFELSPVGTSWTETVLYSFTKGTDGAYPTGGLVMDAAGNFYGTNDSSYGLEGSQVFELSPSADGWTERTIYTTGYGSFGDSYAGLTMDGAGNIFGLTFRTVFELSPDGSGGWTPALIHTFDGALGNGYGLGGTPVLDKSGNIYFTTTEGGAGNCGTVLELSPGKGRAWTARILYSFKGAPGDGNLPFGGLVLDAVGNIYGTTAYGGMSNSGIVYELVDKAGTGNYKEKVLWSFNGTDGESPYGSLIIGRAAKLYGTTLYGGPDWHGVSTGNGIVFEVTP